VKERESERETGRESERERERERKRKQERERERCDFLAPSERADGRADFEHLNEQARERER